MSTIKFQSFHDAIDTAQTAPRLGLLREKLADQNIDGFIIPRADEHQNEYVPVNAERLAWLTGFNGSAGTAIVTADKAALFVDGRYTVQAGEQVSAKHYVINDISAETPAHWLTKNLQRGARFGYDSWLHTPAQATVLRKAAETAGATLVALDENPIDAIWQDQPAAPRAPIYAHPAKFSGESAEEKIARVREALGAEDGLFISDPHAMAWLLNIRGGDVAHTPIALAWAFLPRENQLRLYVDPVKINAEINALLVKNAEILSPENLAPDLEKWGVEKQRIRFDAATAPDKLVSLFEQAGGMALVGNDPIALMKARKNTAELRGARAANIRDGAAVTNFLCWIASQPTKTLTEITAVAALEDFRRKTKKLQDLSFPTISAFGAHAALPHYRVTEKSDRRFEKGLYLVDSGGQYADGTTDVTRTIVIGKPSAEMRDRFTRVLKGHIAIATAVFPVGTSGAQIDAFARKFLWDAGLDFDHGVGHGVGSFLSVHEGPQRISRLGHVALEQGMILSNEPGYYKPGAYGIRIENLLVVELRKIPGAERKMLGFETISFAPIDLALVNAKMLTKDERAWLDAYHAEVRARLLPKVEPQTRAWLKQATKKLA